VVGSSIGHNLVLTSLGESHGKCVGAVLDGCPAGLELDEKDIQYEIQGVYGVYDIELKLASDDIDTLRSTITNKIRKITSVQSTLTMMVIEGQE